jgi:hypothetical protein
MALWGLAWLGSTPVGGPIMGWIGQAAGARWSLVVGGGATLICGVAALPALLRIDRRLAASRPPPGTDQPAASDPAPAVAPAPNRDQTSASDPVTAR